MSIKSPTPDRMPLARRAHRLDKAPKGVSCRDNKPQIVGNKLGPSSAMDSGKSTGGVKLNSSLGAGSGSNAIGGAWARKR